VLAGRRDPKDVALERAAYSPHVNDSIALRDLIFDRHAYIWKSGQAGDDELPHSLSVCDAPQDHHNQ
jgi:hypothetical protein